MIFKIFKITFYYRFENLEFKKYNLKIKISFRKKILKCKEYILEKKNQNTKFENAFHKEIFRI